MTLITPMINIITLMHRAKENSLLNQSKWVLGSKCVYGLKCFSNMSVAMAILQINNENFHSHTYTNHLHTIHPHTMSGFYSLTKEQAYLMQVAHQTFPAKSLPQQQARIITSKEKGPRYGCRAEPSRWALILMSNERAEQMLTFTITSRAQWSGTRENASSSRTCSLI